MKNETFAVGILLNLLKMEWIVKTQYTYFLTTSGLSFKPVYRLPQLVFDACSNLVQLYKPNLNEIGELGGRENCDLNSDLHFHLLCTFPQPEHIVWTTFMVLFLS